MPTPMFRGPPHFPKGLREAFEIDLRALAVLRMTLGLLILLDLIRRLPFLSAFYTDAGVTPRIALISRTIHPTLSLHLLGGGAGYQAVLFGLAALCALALVAGFRTRLATGLSWFLILSLHLRSPSIGDGGDSLLRMLLFWSIFLPLGSIWSLDARSRRGGQAVIVSVATVALLLQPVLMYFSAGFQKGFGTTWQDGSAVFYALSDPRWRTGFGTWMAGHPSWIAPLTYGTLGLELAVPLLLFSPFLRSRMRLVGLLLLVAFQLGLASSIQLGMFPLVSLASLIAFVPATVWDRLPLLPRGPAWEAAEDALESGRHPPRRWAPAGFTLVPAVALAMAGWLWFDALFPLAQAPAILHVVGRTVGLSQNWGMYAPDPLLTSSRVELDVLRDGRWRSVDVDGQDPAWEPLERLRGDYRAKIFLEGIGNGAPPWEVWGLSLWTCAKLSVEGAVGAPDSVRIAANARHLSLNADPGPGVRRILASYPCSAEGSAGDSAPGD